MLMFPDTTASKVTAAHLGKTALLYVRQSTIRQVLHNTESALRQYDLRGRAIALGWAADQITVIDIDQGQSEASAADREGFQQLVADVSLGRAGIVLGLECSRLARNSADWHQLLELCALSGTLICDEDGLYDPRQFNDRLVRHEVLRDRVEVKRPPPLGRRSGPVEAGGSPNRGTPGRTGSSPDNDGTRRHCQTARVRQARPEGVREEPACKAP